ncbi:hypothetical protein KFK09_027439 [Dendrobium nobile]|uniref:Uncharacterized protein n=1 Tax=Dendrobium nobile TaxID=94219 RepID=A0A8T3AAQ9_DENNO|nr:hypothetical protein KFK09_027439 [Dendrobium nobile]
MLLVKFIRFFFLEFMFLIDWPPQSQLNWLQYLSDSWEAKRNDGRFADITSFPWRCFISILPYILCNSLYFDPDK